MTKTEELAHSRADRSRQARTRTTRRMHPRPEVLTHEPTGHASAYLSSIFSSLPSLLFCPESLLGSSVISCFLSQRWSFLSRFRSGFVCISQNKRECALELDKMDQPGSRNRRIFLHVAAHESSGCHRGLLRRANLPVVFNRHDTGCKIYCSVIMDTSEGVLQSSSSAGDTRVIVDAVYRRIDR